MKDPSKRRSSRRWAQLKKKSKRFFRWLAKHPIVTIKVIEWFIDCCDNLPLYYLSSPRKEHGYGYTQKEQQVIPYPPMCFI